MSSFAVSVIDTEAEHQFLCAVQQQVDDAISLKYLCLADGPRFVEWHSLATF
jgi:hypothetical protein